MCDLASGRCGAFTDRRLCVAELVELAAYEQENNHQGSMTVSTRSIPRILGKSGSTINQIRDDTGAQIDVEREDKGAETASISLRGSKKAVEAAKKAIQAVAAEVDAEQVISEFAIFVCRIGLNKSRFSRCPRAESPSRTAHWCTGSGNPRPRVARGRP